MVTGWSPALGLYVLAALLIGYFGVNAFSGNHGLKAKQDLDQQIASLSPELAQIQRERAALQRRHPRRRGQANHRAPRLRAVSSAAAAPASAQRSAGFAVETWL